MLRPLPNAISRVMVPEYFSPSALGAVGDCRLKFLVASLRRLEWTERLVAGPEAAVGTLLHRVIERATQEGTPAEQIFREEYDRAVDEIRQDLRRAHFADLASTKSLAEWTRLKAWILRRAVTGAVRNTGVSGTPGNRATTGSEVLLESRALRLRGRADTVRRLGPNVYEVRDFKTGVTLDEEGQIKSGIALQLRAYGLLLLERLPNAEVRLVVDDGQDREVPFDLEARRDASTAIATMTATMPQAGPAAIDDLARPGGECFTCSIRHVCPMYLVTAPTWWKEYPVNVERVPNDIWGTALEVIGEGEVDLILRDDAGRRVRIDGVAARHGILSSLQGKRVWFFGLEATGATRGFSGARFHSRTFHELPRDRTERRAWAVEAFAAPIT